MLLSWPGAVRSSVLVFFVCAGVSGGLLGSPAASWGVPGSLPAPEPGASARNVGVISSVPHQGFPRHPRRPMQPAPYPLEETPGRPGFPRPPRARPTAAGAPRRPRWPTGSGQARLRHEAETRRFHPHRRHLPPSAGRFSTQRPRQRGLRSRHFARHRHGCCHPTDWTTRAQRHVWALPVAGFPGGPAWVSKQQLRCAGFVSEKDERS